MLGGYNSGGEGSNAGGIEIDPFTGIPYYDPMKRNGKPSSSQGGGSVAGGAVRNSAIPGRRVGGVSALGEKGHGLDNVFSSIFCFGDFEEIVKYNLENMRWEKLKYDSGSSFGGNLRYAASACTIDGRIIVTGGCLISTGDATNTTFETNM